jgi:hypothetical protein
MRQSPSATTRPFYFAIHKVTYIVVVLACLQVQNMFGAARNKWNEIRQGFFKIGVSILVENHPSVMKVCVRKSGDETRAFCNVVFLNK